MAAVTTANEGPACRWRSAHPGVRAGRRTAGDPGCATETAMEGTPIAGSVVRRQWLGAVPATGLWTENKPPPGRIPPSMRMSLVRARSFDTSPRSCRVCAVRASAPTGVRLASPPGRRCASDPPNGASRLARRRGPMIHRVERPGRPGARVRLVYQYATMGTETRIQTTSSQAITHPRSPHSSSGSSRGGARPSATSKR